MDKLAQDRWYQRGHAGTEIKLGVMQTFALIAIVKRDLYMVAGFRSASTVDLTEADLFH